MKVLKFEASWCGPCKMLSRVLEDMELSVEVDPIDVDTNQELAVKYGIRGVPTCVLLNDEGVEIRRQSGYMTEAQFNTFVDAT